MNTLEQASLLMMFVLSGLVGGMVDLQPAGQRTPRRKPTTGQWLGRAMVGVGAVAAFVGFGLLFTALTETTAVTERDAAAGAVTFVAALVVTFSGIGVLVRSSAHPSEPDRHLPRVTERPARSDQPSGRSIGTSSGHRTAA